MAETRQFLIPLFWLIHFTIFTHAEVSCPGDYVPSEESSSCVNAFVDLDRGYSWDEARDKCRLDGGDLVKIVNLAMNNFLYVLAMRDSDFSEKEYRWTWIGLNDPNSDDTWVWLDEEDQAAWTNWARDEPASTYQYCVALDGDYYGQWRDLECTYSTPNWYGECYICEIPALTTTTATTTTTMTTRTTSMAETTPEITTTATSASSGTTSTTTSLSDVTNDSSFGGLGVADITGIVTGVLVVAALVPAAFLAIRYLRNRQRTGHSHTNHSVAYTNGLDDREAIVTVG